MTLYYKLPIYKSSYELTKMLFQETENFVREYKYTIGQQLKNETMILIKNIYRANKAIDKLADIDAAGDNVEIIRLQLRLMQELGQLSLKKFANLSLVVEEVSRQLTAWEKYSKAKIIPEKTVTSP